MELFERVQIKQWVKADVDRDKNYRPARPDQNLLSEYQGGQNWVRRQANGEQRSVLEAGEWNWLDYKARARFGRISQIDQHHLTVVTDGGDIVRDLRQRFRELEA